LKSRSIAQEFIRGNNVRVNGDIVSQPSAQGKAGDRVELRLARRNVALIVKAGGERRGPFEEAKLLYEDVSPPAEEQARLTLFEQAQRAPGAGRPTKKERREIDRLVPDGDSD
jgi:ribosome-associated heat shock protein Hsp15